MHGGECLAVSLGHHQDDGDGVGRAGASKGKEQAPCTQEGHDGRCHFHLVMVMLMIMVMVICTAMKMLA